jgi:hypothetical protein
VDLSAERAAGTAHHKSDVEFLAQDFDAALELNAVRGFDQHRVAAAQNLSDFFGGLFGVL